MKTSDIINGFVSLGEHIKSFLQKGENNENSGSPYAESLKILRNAVEKSEEINPWFTKENIYFALHAIKDLLQRESLGRWIADYLPGLEEAGRKRSIGVITAGNIPLVGFHDFLCVSMTGHRFIGKLSSDDILLLPSLTEILGTFSSEFQDRIKFVEDRLVEFDAVIATGSNNTNRYFEYYFGKYPHILRKNRNSTAILNGNETTEELERLSEDVFLYFGRGCRSVCKIFLPQGYDPETLINPFSKYQPIINHHKYRNNYDYYRSIFLLNRTPFLDSGYFLMIENSEPASPVSVLNLHYYKKMDEVNEWLSLHKQDIQCVVGNAEDHEGAIPYGTAQKPGLTDYADGLDTVEFLLRLND